MKSRRRRHGDSLRRAAATVALGLMATTAQAACPPVASDGTVLQQANLLLAWRPLLKAEPGASASRIPMAKHFALEVQLCDKAGISVARLQKADATMPEHRHGMNYRPAITPLGAGRFRVEGMMLHMAGRWQLAFEVRAGDEVIRLTDDIRID